MFTAIASINVPVSDNAADIMNKNTRIKMNEFRHTCNKVIEKLENESYDYKAAKAYNTYVVNGTHKAETFEERLKELFAPLKKKHPKWYNAFAKASFYFDEFGYLDNVFFISWEDFEEAYLSLFN